MLITANPSMAAAKYMAVDAFEYFSTGSTVVVVVVVVVVVLLSRVPCTD